MFYCLLPFYEVLCDYGGVFCFIVCCRFTRCFVTMVVCVCAMRASCVAVL